ncbi:unnamed protein product [Lactuca virosa]|uniref:Replication protein A 70 kDa DNA-binding subunit B/D first OB fold domain-containing protein n=1 Tax=Lactuca virosa TaxID=75947 RepID=A0AAU9LRD9_9ASTR|nr:unnamed protein product [Lactuca virosa]
MEHITPINEIYSIKEDFTIKVRIIRLWTQKSKFDPNETYSIEIILMDEEGSKIHVSCGKKWFSKLQRYLKEDSSIYVKKPNVAPNTSKLKFSDPEIKLNFYHDTTVVLFYPAIVILVSQNGQQLLSSAINMIASKQDTEHDDFLKNHLFSNIDDLFEPLEEKTVIVGTVKGIRQNIRWYYLACSNCKKSSRQKESSTDKVDGSHEVAKIVTYECVNPICKNIQISVIPRFKIPLRFQDNTTTLTLTLFDQEEKKLFKYTAKEFFDKNKKIGSSDIGSQETRVVKDSFSQTAKNLTPCARDNSTTTSPT